MSFIDAEILASGRTDVLEGLDALRIGLCVFGPDDVLRWTNAHFDFVFPEHSFTRAAIGQTHQQILHNLLEHGAIAGLEALEDPDGWIARHITHIRSGWAPDQWHLADGRIMEWKYRAMPDGGRIGVMEDITHRVKTSNRFVDAIDTAMDGFALWDQRGRLSYANQRFAKIHGQAFAGSISDIPYTAYLDALTEADLIIDPAADQGVAAMRAIFTMPLGQITVQFRDGKWYMVSTRRMRDGGVAMIITDISELKTREQELVQRGKSLEATISELETVQATLEDQGKSLVTMAEQLEVSKLKAEAANEAKTVFLRSLSHELRTPLNAVIGFADVMRLQIHGPLGADAYTRCAEDISRSGHHLLNLISQMLDASRMESGRFELRPVTVDFDRLLDETRMAVITLFEQANVDLIINPLPDQLPTLVADQMCIQQILSNLLGNASKFTPACGTVTLDVVAHDQCVAFTVTDTGCGIPKEDLERILMPFEQVRNGAHVAHHPGTGLGLSIARTMAELHGGTLKLDSEVGKGTIATLTLPLQPTNP